MLKSAAENSAKKQRGRPFEKGQSGNPKGKPKGARNKATLAAEVLLDGEAEAITRKAIELAKGGDITAIRLCLERIIPPRKERPVAASLPCIDTVEDLPAAQLAIIKAVATGDLVPSEASAMAGLFEGYRRTIETIEFEKRLMALERKSEEERPDDGPNQTP